LRTSKVVDSEEFVKIVLHETVKQAIEQGVLFDTKEIALIETGIVATLVFMQQHDVETVDTRKAMN